MSYKHGMSEKTKEISCFDIINVLEVNFNQVENGCNFMLQISWLLICEMNKIGKDWFPDPGT